VAFPYRVARHVNSWNLSGWTVEHFYTSVQRWVPGDFYWTHGGARRELDRIRAYYRWRKWVVGS